MCCPMRRIAITGLVLISAEITPTATAQVIAPSVYTTTIQVQGEVVGAEYDDWDASGLTLIPDDADNIGDIDLAGVQIANDDQFVYIHATFHNTEPTSLANLFLAFDTDQTKTTGFDVLQIGELGSELGYQTDYPFAQHAAAFNLNLSLTGGPVGNGGALIYPFWTEAGAPVGNEFEWAIPLDAVIQFPPALGGPAPSIPNPSFDFVIYTPNGLADITSVISYTLAEPPAGTPGDFDDDGDVDGADFLEWQQGLGGEFDAMDLADWKLNFGTGGGVAAAASIPEPASLLLVALGVLGIASRRTRRV
ncbi:MAG: PEP-CTERM sorting domain-containing protein [Pirellulales bacterium]|nr:PEP-CTERM sorting domain-containing protein [Pirellulales bacterium]